MGALAKESTHVRVAALHHLVDNPTHRNGSQHAVGFGGTRRTHWRALFEELVENAIGRMSEPMVVKKRGPSVTSAPSPSNLRYTE